MTELHYAPLELDKLLTRDQRLPRDEKIQAILEGELATPTAVPLDNLAWAR